MSIARIEMAIPIIINKFLVTGQVCFMGYGYFVANLDSAAARIDFAHEDGAFFFTSPGNNAASEESRGKTGIGSILFPKGDCIT